MNDLHIDTTVWKVMSISLLTFLLGVFGAGAFGHFEQSALEIRVQQLELSNGVTSQRLTENERHAIAVDAHLEAVDKQIQQIREDLARQRRLNQ